MHLMMRLADNRQLLAEDFSEVGQVSENFLGLLLDWYLAGWLIF
jgi:hypothetical protein